MPAETLDPMAEARRMLGKARPPCAELMDWRMESWDPETMTIVISYAAHESFTNPMGAIQGGILAAMMDDTMGPAVVIACGRTKFPLTTDLHATYYRGVGAGGRLTVTGRVDHLGATIAYMSAEIRDEAGALIAKAIQTGRLKDHPRPPRPKEA